MENDRKKYVRWIYAAPFLALTIYAVVQLVRQQISNPSNIPVLAVILLCLVPSLVAIRVKRVREMLEPHPRALICTGIASVVIAFVWLAVWLVPALGNPQYVPFLSTQMIVLPLLAAFLLGWLIATLPIVFAVSRALMPALKKPDASLDSIEPETGQ